MKLDTAAEAMITCCHIDSPAGSLLVAATDHALIALQFAPRARAMPLHERWQEGDSALLARVRAELAQYFAGVRRRFELPLDPQGTRFQQQVWRALREIPYGHTWSYGQLARHIRAPAASRAVGAAAGRNPIAIIVPCHRVIGANGSLTGFAGGLAVKRQLLELERAR